ncbi:transposase [Streptomyces sp. NBC_01314]|uniref:transposase n=1 Tax=Streptomyces sp. NBC_01314 TaxID=2903821 RepID=UPI00308D16E2|nr:transposase [Streptomyces sp. NBC_01314]
MITGGQWRDGDPDVLVVVEDGYDARAWPTSFGLPVEVLGRLRSDRVMRKPVPQPRKSPPQGGRPPKHGKEFRVARPDTWGEPDTATMQVTDRYGTARAMAWDRIHPRLTTRSAWIDHVGELPLIEGTLIRLQADHLPGGGDPLPVWLWSSGTGMNSNLTPDMLLLADRAFHTNDLLAQIARRGTQFLVRCTSRRHPPVLALLPDGSYLARVVGLTLRVIEAEIRTRTADGSTSATPTGDFWPCVAYCATLPGFENRSGPWKRTWGAMKKVMVAAVASLLLVGCSSAEEKARDSESKPEATAVESQAIADVVEDEPDPVTVDEISCDWDDYTSVEEAWAGKHEHCDVTLSGTEMSDTETKAVETAYGDEEERLDSFGRPDEEGDLQSLGVLYSICAESAPRNYLDSANEVQKKEIRGAFLLCPVHPQARKYRKQIKDAQERDKLRAEGRVFGEGVHRVGPDEIKPGTYFVTDVEGCYWERTDANGETLDNNFVTAAKRVQVTIIASDYSFNSRSCGEWQPVGI